MERQNIASGAPWEDVGRAHREFFGDIRPATSMVEVSKLITPEILVEIEADAYLDDNTDILLPDALRGRALDVVD